MEKITVCDELYGQLIDLCERMQVAEDATAPDKLADHLREVRRMSGILSHEADLMGMHAYDALDQLYEKNFADGIVALGVMVEQLREMRDSLDSVYANFAHALCCMRKLTEPAGWTPTCKDEEVRAAIDEGFQLTNLISLGYQDRTYALLFEKEGSDGEFVKDPFVVAIGGEEYYEDVLRYVGKLMDAEESV